MVAKPAPRDGPGESQLERPSGQSLEPGQEASAPRSSPAWAAARVASSYGLAGSVQMLLLARGQFLGERPLPWQQWCYPCGETAQSAGCEAVPTVGARRAGGFNSAKVTMLPAPILRPRRQGVVFFATRAAIASRSTLSICARKFAQLCLISLTLVKCGEIIGAPP